VWSCYVPIGRAEEAVGFAPCETLWDRNMGDGAFIYRFRAVRIANPSCQSDRSEEAIYEQQASWTRVGMFGLRMAAKQNPSASNCASPSSLGRTASITVRPRDALTRDFVGSLFDVSLSEH
jgi:hypothetical protein